MTIVSIFYSGRVKFYHCIINLSGINGDIKCKWLQQTNEENIWLVKYDLMRMPTTLQLNDVQTISINVSSIFRNLKFILTDNIREIFNFLLLGFLDFILKKVHTLHTWKQQPPGKMFLSELYKINLLLG